MTNSSEDNLHYGMVKSIKDSIIEVEVNAPIACSSCQVSSSCGLASDDLKIITVKAEVPNYSIGERVKVVYEEELSGKALFIVYIAPLILLFIVMAIATVFTDNEIVIGLLMVFSLIPFFLLFKLFNNKIAKVFAFTIQKMDELKNTQAL